MFFAPGFLQSTGICVSFALRCSKFPWLVNKTVIATCFARSWLNSHWNWTSFKDNQPQNMSETAGIERLQQNAKVAEGLIAEISSKIRLLTPNPDLENIKATNEELRKEVEKWTEILTMVEIRKGLEPLYYLHYSTGEQPANVGGQNQQSQKQVTSQQDAGPEEKPKKDANANVAPKKGKNVDKAESQTSVGEKPAKQSKKSQPKPANNTASATAPAEVVDVSRLDFRIGKIVEVDRHPEADSLYLEKIDVGEPNPRTVISGLVKHVPLEEMKNRMVVVLCNLKPAKMRGIMSEGMVMCASSPEKVEVLNPPQGVVPGDLIEFEGYTRNADQPFMNPKKKVFESVAPDLKTNDSKVATYKGVAFTVPGKGVVSADTLVNVAVK